MIMVRNLRVARVACGDAVVVTVAGDVDLRTAGELSKELTAARLLALPSWDMVVDLTAVRFFGAAGLTVLVMTDHDCQEQGVVLWIVANHRAVLRPLEITKLIDTLPVIPAMRPEWVRRQRTARATRAVLGAARRILRSPAEKPVAMAVL
jgi:anti-sigma B factor antagonist